MPKTSFCCALLLNLTVGLSIFLLSPSSPAVQSLLAEGADSCVSSNASQDAFQPLPLKDLMNCSKVFQTGEASIYGEGDGLDGRKTASGEPLDSTAMTAAHKTLPIGTWILVHNLKTKEEVHVRINDRGPYHKKRILDLSSAAAEKIGLNTEMGTARIQIRICKPK